MTHLCSIAGGSARTRCELSKCCMGQLLLQVIVMVKVFSSEEDDADLTLFLLCSSLLYLGPSSVQNVRDYDSLSKDCVQRLAVKPSQ